MSPGVLPPLADPELSGRRARLAAPFVLLTGGKGGVGKSTLAANLGVQLAREGRRVLLADLDLGLANLNVLLRLAPERTLEDVLSGSASAAECVLEGPGGVHVLPAGSGTAAMGRPDPARRALLFAALAELSRDYELVLGDSAAGIGPDVLAFATTADRVLAVTTPEPAALTDAYGLIKALDTFSHEHALEVPTPELVINLADGAQDAESTAAKLRAVCERFLARSPRLAGWLPRSALVRAAATRQQPFVLGGPDAGDPPARDSLESACLRRLAGRVARFFPGGEPGLFELKPQGGHGR